MQRIGTEQTATVGPRNIRNRNPYELAWHIRHPAPEWVQEYYPVFEMNVYFSVTQYLNVFYSITQNGNEYYNITQYLNDY